MQTQPLTCIEVRSTQDPGELAGCAIVAQKLSPPGNDTAGQVLRADSQADTVLAVIRQFYPRISTQAVEEIRRILQDNS